MEREHKTDAKQKKEESSFKNCQMEQRAKFTALHAPIAAAIAQKLQCQPKDVCLYSRLLVLHKDGNSSDLFYGAYADRAFITMLADENTIDDTFGSKQTLSGFEVRNGVMQFDSSSHDTRYLLLRYEKFFFKIVHLYSNGSISYHCTSEGTLIEKRVREFAEKL